MATSGQVVVRDDYFYCSICLEIYDTPRTLPCLHSFCQECLKGYILKIKEKTGTQQLFCPTCRADTKTDTDKFKQVDKWVEYFPINFTLLSILNERKLTMNPKENNCEACLREEIKVDACVYCYDCSEKLCEECKRHHKKNKLLSNHKLIDITHDGDSNYDMAKVEYLANLSKCPTHETEEVKYICKDHDQLCCNECAIVTHRKCEDILSLAEEIKVKKEQNTKSNVQARLDNVCSYVDELIKHETEYLENIDKKENEMRKSLKDVKAKLDAAYNKLEERIMLKLSERKKALSKNSSIQKESLEDLKKYIKQADQTIKNANTMGTRLHEFLLEREIGKRLTQYEETFTALRNKSSKAVTTLCKRGSLDEIVTKIEDLYKIEEVDDDEQDLSTISKHKDIKNRKLILEREVNLKKGWPRYCLWIGNYIIVSFEFSSMLEAYKACDGSLLSSYECPSPTSVVATENDEFAVASRSSNKINIMTIKDDQMVCLRQLSCPNYDLISYNSKDKQIITLSQSEMVLRKISLDGKDAGCIDLTRLEKSLLECTYNIYVDSRYDRIFISSAYQNKLLCIDISGDKIFQHEIKCPWSVITDSQGNIYVASWTGNCIQQLSPNGQISRADILEDNNVLCPMALSFNEDMNKLVVTSNTLPVNMRIFNFQ